MLTKTMIYHSYLPNRDGERVVKISKTWRNWSFHTFLVGMQCIIATLENSSTLSYEGRITCLRNAKTQLKCSLTGEWVDKLWHRKV